MKKYILSSLAVLSATALLTSCNDMLDTDPRVTELTQATFPGKPGDVEAEITGIYSIMNTMGGGDSDTYNPFYWWEIMSDDCYGSGGLQDNKVKSMHYLVEMNSNQYETPFTLLYGGISRCNNTIETIDNVKWTDDQKGLRDQLLGEAFFMRGLYTLWLTQLFGDVPLITATLITPEMEQQVSAEEKIYPQIFSDLVSASKLMGTSRGHGDGHANKFAAEAFLARAYMFWAGFYKGVKELASSDATATLVKQEGVEEGATLSKQNVIDALKDVIDNGGYTLVEDFRSLWQYSNSLVYDEAHAGGGVKEITAAGDTVRTGHGAKHLQLLDGLRREQCFDMPGMGNGNTEEIFQIQFMNASKWGINGAAENGGIYSTARMYSNYISCFWGLRVNGNNGNRDYTYPYSQGWGQGTPSVNIYEDWTSAETRGGYTDNRKYYSVINCEQDLDDYTYVKDDCEESGYAVRKYMGVTLDACSSGDNPWWTKAPGYSSSSLDNPMQGDHFEDYYLMRYADVLLMMTELTGQPQYMNQVQARAGVPQTGYTLENIQNERRWELVFEGLRFNDMRRWSGCDGHSENSYAAKALQAQDGKPIVVMGDKANKLKMHYMHEGSSWAKRYAATKGFLAKPRSQINLMNGKLEQNAGWDGSPETQYKVLY